MLVFVYGTLTDPDRVGALVEAWRFEGPAELEGLRRAKGRYPTLAPVAEGVGGEGNHAGDSTVGGRLLRTPAIAALDAYEGVDSGLYARVAVPVAGRDEDAAVYVGDPAKLGVDATWPGEGPLAGRVRRYVDRRGVVIRPVPD